MYAVFKIPKSKLDVLENIYKDDSIGRQTIVKRDGRSLGLDDEGVYLLIEGSEPAVKKAREILKEMEMSPNDAEIVYAKIKESEEEASLGMGAIFG